MGYSFILYKFAIRIEYKNMKSALLLNELMEITRQNLSDVEGIYDLSERVLNYKKNKDSWSALECIEHIVRYGSFYLPEIHKCIEMSNKPGDGSFKSGWLGNYFAKSMLPREKPNKMNTFKSMNPLGSKLDVSVLRKFIAQQNELLGVLN